MVSTASKQELAGVGPQLCRKCCGFRAMVHWRLMINMTDLIQQMNFALEIQCFHA
jgi:hypothetical protein